MKPAGAAQAAAQAVRDLNHATVSGTGYAYPSDVYEVLGALVLLAQRLPQALTQAGVWLDREHDAGRVGHDSGEALKLASDLSAALLGLSDAVGHAAALATALDQAQQSTARLHGRS